MENKLYILIDNNLSPIYGAVQGGHAVAEWMTNNVDINYNKFAVEYQPNWKWENEYLIYLSVDIEKWYHLLCENKAKYFECFMEPDLENRMTAIAVWEGGLPEILKQKIKNEDLLY